MRKRTKDTKLEAFVSRKSKQINFCVILLCFCVTPRCHERLSGNFLSAKLRYVWSCRREERPAEWRVIIGIAIAFILASILLATCLILGTPVCQQDYSPSSLHLFQYHILAYVPHFIFGAAATHLSKHYNSNKQSAINRPTKNNAKISIFEGRGAVTNLAIFHILVAARSLSMGGIQRRLNRISGFEATYYASLNKRIHTLVRDGYLGEVKPADSGQAGFKVTLYEVLPKFYLAYYLNGKKP